MNVISTTKRNNAYIGESRAVLNVGETGDDVAAVGVGLLGLDLLCLDHRHGGLAVGQHRIHRGLHL